tara:strand:+ start:1497 stop:1751 length:255 start_codon:yes stop_codon:yes gene_type:complete
MTIQVGDARADIKVLKIYQEIERNDKEFYVCLVQGKSTHTGLVLRRSILTLNEQNQLVECGNVKRIDDADNFDRIIDSYLETYG